MLLPAVPHLETALKGPLLNIEKKLLANKAVIESWFRCQFRNTPAPFYASVDLRNAGFKLAPVDTNLFPAGFNNLHPDLRPLAIKAVQNGIERHCPITDGVLIIPENHTRNLYYLENLCTLAGLITDAGYAVRIGSLNPEIQTATNIDLPSGRPLTLEPIVRTGNRVGVDQFFPCAVLLNNDLASGIPDCLQGIEQVLLPPPSLGWHSRTKSAHFTHYRDVAQEFAEMIDCDPWFFDPLFSTSVGVDFKEGVGIDKLINECETLLVDIQTAYDAHGIEQKPYLIVKADAGTYGMGVMSIQDPQELAALNKNARKKMTSGKEGLSTENVIIQEGIYTFETVSDAVAEPVVYMIDHAVIGGFYRVHTGKTATDNLNAVGMHFEPLAFADACIQPDARLNPDAAPNRFYAYGVVARLALIAAARELHDTQNQSK
ncbi:MAG: glutamate--cysteine ligase [Proteobacteria bacterium]|nr:glutamate--cysteine ligase [Pseudomonadota bacterium]